MIVDIIFCAENYIDVLSSIQVKYTVFCVSVSVVINELISNYLAMKLKTFIFKDNDDYTVHYDTRVMHFC